MNAGQLGSAALWGAVLAGGASIVVPRDWCRRLLALAALLASLSTLILVWALLTVDLSLAYVADTTSRLTPWPYRVAALWGGMDGSMLFYAAMATVVSAIALRTRSRAPALRVGAGVAAALLAFAAVFANPFMARDIPAVEGTGLLAILQHPAMIYHPPLLYLGLTALLVPFALGVEGAATPGGLDIRSARRWLLGSWTLLTFGMVAGSTWAYVELGWGGFWAWDPVENTSLMPWLAATAFLHSSRVTERDGRLARVTTALAMVPFALSVLGVYLTRSGVTGSIHAFAEDPVIGRILLGAAVVTLTLVAALAIKSAPGPAWGELGTGRAVWLTAHVVLVVAALTFVAVGSAYPAYASVFFGEGVAIDPAFFVITVYPLALLITAGLAMALRTGWGKSGLRPWEWAVMAITAAFVAVAVELTRESGSWPAAVGIGVAVAAIAAVLADLLRSGPRGRALTPYLAHLGIALVVFGAAGSALGEEYAGTMRPGDSVAVGGHTIRLESIVTGEEGRIQYARAAILLDGATRLHPEIRAYEGQSTPVSEPELSSNLGADVIVATSLLFPDATAVEVSVFVRPLVWWVWIGALLLGASGLLALVGRGGDGAAPRRSAIGERPTAETTTGRSAR